MLSTVIVPVRTGEIVVITDAMAEELELKEWQRSVHHEDEKWSEYAYTYVAGALNAQGWKQKSADETE